VFFHLGAERAVLSDRNADLIEMYRAVAADTDGVVRRLALHQEAHDSEHYYQTRARWNDRSVSWSSLDRAATFIYLNRTCFNGLWRVNRGGGFNVPMGRYKNPSICDVETLERAAGLLRKTTLLCGDYQAAVADAGPGDLVYFDPPYDPVTPTANFTAYTGDGFRPHRAGRAGRHRPHPGRPRLRRRPVQQRHPAHPGAVQGPPRRPREVPPRHQLGSVAPRRRRRGAGAGRVRGPGRQAHHHPARRRALSERYGSAATRVRTGGGASKSVQVGVGSLRLRSRIGVPPRSSTSWIDSQPGGTAG
jgi:hypothetical protein